MSVCWIWEHTYPVKKNWMKNYPLDWSEGCFRRNGWSYWGAGLALSLRLEFALSSVNPCLPRENRLLTWDKLSKFPEVAKIRFTYYPVSSCRYLISLLSEFEAEAVLDCSVLWVSDICQVLKRCHPQRKRNWSLDSVCQSVFYTLKHIE